LAFFSDSILASASIFAFFSASTLAFCSASALAFCSASTLAFCSASALTFCSASAFCLAADFAFCYERFIDPPRSLTVQVSSAVNDFLSRGIFAAAFSA
jgi:hypothetical protein